MKAELSDFLDTIDRLDKYLDSDRDQGLTAEALKLSEFYANIEDVLLNEPKTEK